MGRVSKFKKLKSVDPFNTKAQKRAEQLALKSMPEKYDAKRDEKLSFKARQLIHGQNQLKSTIYLLLAFSSVGSMPNGSLSSVCVKFPRDLSSAPSLSPPCPSCLPIFIYLYIIYHFISISCDTLVSASICSFVIVDPLFIMVL